MFLKNISSTPRIIHIEYETVEVFVSSNPCSYDVYIFQNENITEFFKKNHVSRYHVGDIAYLFLINNALSEIVMAAKALTKC